MASLYEINAAIMSCMSVDDETGEVTFDEAQLEALELMRDEKREDIALWVKNLDSDITAYKAEKKAFDEKIRAAESKKERLEALLENELQGSAFKTSKVAITFRKSERVEVTNESALPENFLRIKREADKVAIKAALKNGIPIQGAELVEALSMSIK